MRIGVVSDTHARPLPKQMLDDFQDVDLIIHAGDMCDWEHYQQLKKIAAIRAVYGNMDGEEIRKKLSPKDVLDCEDVKIGIYHGDGPPKTLLHHVQRQFEKDKPNAVIFGHSHEPLNEVIDQVLYFNPGSPNDTIFAPYCSYGILEVDDKKISGEIIKVKT